MNVDLMRRVAENAANLLVFLADEHDRRLAEEGS